MGSGCAAEGHTEPLIPEGAVPDARPTARKRLGRFGWCTRPVSGSATRGLGITHVWHDRAGACSRAGKTSALGTDGPDCSQQELPIDRYRAEPIDRCRQGTRSRPLLRGAAVAVKDRLEVPGDAPPIRGAGVGRGGVEARQRHHSAPGHRQARRPKAARKLSSRACTSSVDSP